MLSILRKARLKDKEMRILMLGLDNSGKTSIVKNIMGEDINTVSPTLGFIIKTIEYDGKDVELTAEVDRYKLNICEEIQDVVQDADTETYTGQGTSADRRRSGHTGRTISRRRTRSSGW
ncbi:hypothetical protein E4T47_04283 [Aureobasidium subglaciale]|nr:hypothetical protein E4T47_04283 [Aureobasidium subglaciale]